jgi:hypothetical protein
MLQLAILRLTVNQEKELYSVRLMGKEVSRLYQIVSYLNITVNLEDKNEKENSTNFGNCNVCFNACGLR